MPFTKVTGCTQCCRQICLRQLNCISITKKCALWCRRSDGGPLDWCCRSVVFHTDSTVTQAIINKGCSKTTTTTINKQTKQNPYVNNNNSLLSKVAWACAQINCRISGVHVAGSIYCLPPVPHLLEGKIHELVQLLSCYHRGIQSVIEWNQRMSFCLCRSSGTQPESGAGQRSITVQVAHFSVNTRRTYQADTFAFIFSVL